LTPSLPAPPNVMISRWSAYKESIAEGNKQLNPVWREGIQLLGRDPLTRDAALTALRTRALLLDTTPDPPAETGSRFS
jgi:hypothetical protein